MLTHLPVVHHVFPDQERLFTAKDIMGEKDKNSQPQTKTALNQFDSSQRCSHTCQHTHTHTHTHTHSHTYTHTARDKHTNHRVGDSRECSHSSLASAPPISHSLGRRGNLPNAVLSENFELQNFHEGAMLPLPALQICEVGLAVYEVRHAEG